MTSTTTPRLAIHGAAGRMGRRLVTLTLEDSALKLAAAVDQASHPAQGQDAGVLAGAAPCGVMLSEAIPADVDVVIDFASPMGTRSAIDACVRHGCALVVGTTGLSRADHDALDAAATRIAVLQAPNMSLGVNLLFALAARAAQQLGRDYDIEVVEGHHRFKKDAPSGTAMGIVEAICAATDRSLDEDVIYGRHGGDVVRKPGQIGVHALRLGDEVGRHTVSFATLGEELQLHHHATSRDVFAHGALRAAKWLAGKPAGRYGMKHVLGLD